MAGKEPRTDRSGLTKRYYEELLRFIASRVANREDAKEMTQELFLRFAAYDTPIQPGRERSWLYRVARNIIIDHYRQRREFAPLPEEWLDHRLDSGIADPYEDRDQMEQCLKNLASDLPETYRSALFSGLLSDASRREYARLYGISESGASSRFTRAREHLKKRLQKCCRVQCDASGMPVGMEARDPSTSAC